jgi:NADH:ubiquinone oxidoreductase subunit D
LLELQKQLSSWVIPEFPASTQLTNNSSPLAEIVSTISFGDLLSSLSTALEVNGAFDVQLPKVVKVPRGQSFKQRPTAFGIYGVWLHSDGGKSPQRLSLTPPAISALSRLQSAAIGLDLEEFKSLLIHSPISIGELER